MEIEPSSNRVPVRGVEARTVRRTAAAPGDAGDFANADALRNALENTPDVRPEAVARARELVTSPHYPPEVMVRKLAQLFAVEFGGSRSTTEPS